MVKVKSSDIFKSGEKLEFKKIDYSDPKVRKRLKALLKEQKRIRKSAEFTLEDLRKIVITI
jgi:hypothetical protein